MSYFKCICGKMAKIHLTEWLLGNRKIRCSCGRSLTVTTMRNADQLWAEYMEAEKRLPTS